MTYQREGLEEQALFEEEYASWLMANEHPMWDDRLVELMEKEHRYQEFIETLAEA